MNEMIRSRGRFLVCVAMFPTAIAALALLAGCQSEPSTFETMPATGTNSQPVAFHPAGNVSNQPPAEYVLREGDILNVSFPGSPSLNTVQQIRSDGKINLPLVGEVNAAGLTTSALQKKLVDLYAPQLSTKQVTVDVQSSAFPVYVTGAVLRPGKVSTDHPLTALEAIMEAGGFDYTTANLKDVIVIRQEGNQTKRYRVNLKKVMNGGESNPFYLKPNDIIYVPERFTWF